MRRIMMFNRVSADGYFAAPDGNLNWVVPDDELDKAGADASPHADTVLFGRRTYEMFASFWPHVLEDSSTAPDPHHAGRRSPAMLAMAKMLNEAKKVVFSKTLKEATWNNTRVVREFDPKVIEALKKEPGKGIIIFGSGSIVSQLTEHGLIDEYQFIVNPVFLGKGKSLISGLPNTSRVSLLEAKPYKSGNVMLRYSCAN